MRTSRERERYLKQKPRTPKINKLGMEHGDDWGGDAAGGPKKTQIRTRMTRDDKEEMSSSTGKQH